MVKRLWSAFIMLVLLSGCGWSGTPTRHNDFTPPTSIEISAGSSVIAAKTSIKLTVKGNYSGQYILDITDQAVWSSNAPAVAEFSAAANRVITHSPGTAILTATVKGISSTFTLTVSPATITTLAITPVTPSIAKGLNTQFTAVGTFSDSTTQDLTFDASWDSAAPGVATVGNAVANKGLANALAVGTATISATFDGVSGTTLLTVTAPVPQSIAITPASQSLSVGESKNFVVTASLSDGTTQNVTASSDWSSSSTATATVGNSAADKGLVKAVAIGTATISAVYGSLPAATATVTIAALTIESLALNAVTHTFNSIGEQATFTATANYTNGTSQDVTASAVWTSSNLAVASFVDAQNQPGLIRANASGSAILTVSFGGKTQTATLTVL